MVIADKCNAARRMGRGNARGLAAYASEGFRYQGPLARGRWIDAGNLKPGYRLLNPDGTWAEVVSVTERPGSLDAWNLTVEDAQTYFVAEKEGVDPVWVHNRCSVYEQFSSFERARNRGLDVIGKIDPSTRETVVGRLGDFKGKSVGFRGKTAGGSTVNMRIDWDPENGANINVMTGKGASATNYHLGFPSTRTGILSLIGQIQ